MEVCLGVCGGLSWVVSDRPTPVAYTQISPICSNELKEDIAGCQGMWSGVVVRVVGSSGFFVHVEAESQCFRVLACGHEAQGATSQRLGASLGEVFESGQAYVALSRVRKAEGIVILVK